MNDDQEDDDAHLAIAVMTVIVVMIVFNFCFVLARRNELEHPELIQRKMSDSEIRELVKDEIDKLRPTK